MEVDPARSESHISYWTEINAPTTKVWETISMPGNLKFCHPFCKENPVTKWGGIGAEDTIEYYNGLLLHRRFIKWIEGRGYELLIGQGPYSTAKVLWRISDKGEGASELSIDIHVYPDIALNKIPKPFRWLVKTFYFLPNMSKYLKAVVRGFKFYIETGTPVRKNQFGYVSMFSSRAPYLFTN